MSKIIYGVMGVFVVVILLGSIVMPAIDEATSDGGGGTVIVIEGAGWLRLGYNTGGSIDLSYSVTDSVTATNGSDVQTGSFDDMVLFASDTATIYIDDGDVVVFTKDAQDNFTVGYLDDNFTVISDESSLTIDDAGSQYVCELPTWYYSPKSTGNYATFDDAGFTVPADYSPIAISESFANAIAVNTSVSNGVPLVYDLQKDDNIILGANWVKESVPDDLSIVPLDPSVILDPFNPSITPIDPIDLVGDENIITAVATPTYTDGDWGYNLVGDKAYIVSYSGAGGGQIIIPATIGGYTVEGVAMEGSTDTVFPTDIVATDLVISDGIEKINGYVANGCSGFTGNLIIPSSVTSIGGSAFRGCGFTGNLIIPSSVTSIGTSAFYGCTGFTGNLIIPSSVTSISGSAFRECSGLSSVTIGSSVTTITSSAFRDSSGLSSMTLGSSVTSIGNTGVFTGTSITEVLNLSDIVLSSGSYGLPADVTIRQGDDAQLEALMYLSAATITEGGTGNHNPATDILKMLPIIVIASVLIAIVGIIAYRGKQ